MSEIVLILFVFTLPGKVSLPLRLPTPLVWIAATQSLTVQVAAGCEKEPPDTNAEASLPKIEGKEFSELALFLLGSGFALFIAILGWSDQIRNLSRASDDLVIRFVDKTGIKRGDLSRFLKAKNVVDRAAGLNAIMASERLKTAEQVEATGLFHELARISASLERTGSYKYNLTLCLTACMFAVGTISLFTSPTDQLLVGSASIRVELLIVVAPLIIISIIFLIILRSNFWDKKFNDQLIAISERI